MFFFKHKNKPLLLKEFGILLSTESTLQQLKKSIFLLQILKTWFFGEKKIRIENKFPNETKKQ